MITRLLNNTLTRVALNFGALLAFLFVLAPIALVLLAIPAIGAVWVMHKVMGFNATVIGCALVLLGWRWRPWRQGIGEAVQERRRLEGLGSVSPTHQAREVHIEVKGRVREWE